MLKYHRIVQEGILAFGKIHLGKEVLSISTGGEIMLIPHGTKMIDPITFKPDRVFTLNDRTKLAFQVLGSQASKYREIEADILRAYLCAVISKLVFVVSNEEEANRVSRITSIIQDGFERLGVKKGLNLLVVLPIPNDVKDAHEVLDYLNSREANREIFGKA